MRSPVMKISDGKLRTTGKFEDHINDYIIAVRQSSFYQLQKIEQ